MCSQIRDASDGVALHLDIGRVHLLDQGRQSTESDYGDFVLSYKSQQALVAISREYILLTARLPRAALAARCTSISGFWRRNRMGSRVSRSTSLTSVIRN